MALPSVLRSLLTAPGPSGYETAPTAVWREAASAFAEVTGDSLGSSIARVPGTGEGPLLAIVGHIDEIGLIVTHIDDHGYVFFRPVGGALHPCHGRADAVAADVGERGRRVAEHCRRGLLVAGRPGGRQQLAQ